MADKKDYVRAAITEKLAPILVKEGFVRFKPKQFVRADGDLVHSIAFQMSRYGDQTFFLHYHVNLLCTPSMDIESYRIGSRLSNPPDGYAEWIGDTEENASLAIDGVNAVTQAIILPWFANVQNIRDFIVEWVGNPQSKLEELDMAVAMLVAGYRNRAWWICDALSKQETYEQPISDWDRTCMTYAKKLMDAIDSDMHDKLLFQWRRENIEKNRLSTVLEAKSLQVRTDFRG
jgi:hypothetical protein